MEEESKKFDNMAEIISMFGQAFRDLYFIPSLVEKNKVYNPFVICPSQFLQILRHASRELPVEHLKDVLMKYDKKSTLQQKLWEDA